MQVVICDDDYGCCAKIEKWLIEYRKREKVDLHIDIHYNADGLISRLNEEYWFDVIFLDIELPETTGIELGRMIRDKMKGREISIIFISGKLKYCRQLFSMEPQNFHHKPLKRKEIEADIDRAMERQGKYKQALKYIEDRVTKAIQLGHILYIESKNKNLEILTSDGKRVIVRRTLTQIGQELKRYDFCQCHRSYLVNLYYVERYTDQCFYMKNGDKIPVGKKYINNVKEAWASYGGDYQCFLI